MHYDIEEFKEDPQLGTYCAEGLQSDGEQTYLFRPEKKYPQMV